MLGRLIPDPLTAILELVNNSYYADAEEVTIIFSKKENTIVITDDGHGMSLDDIRHGWLEIGSRIKRQRTRSLRKNRVLSGSWGVGRLLAFSFANMVEMRTGQEGKRWRRILLDLRKIMKISNISKIRVSISTLSDKPRKHGTTITLTQLKWFPKDYEELKQRLSHLRNPKDLHDFTIYLKSDEKTEKIEPQEDLPHASVRNTRDLLHKLIRSLLRIFA